MTPATRSTLGAAMLMLALTILVTWPQAIHLSSMLSPHFDAQFSVWRLGWIAHALSTAPTHIFDANIFYPARATLAYSDATMLQGALGAPLFWAGVSPVLIYNIMLFLGFAASGMTMFVLMKHLSNSTEAAVVAAAIFTVLPYRTEHFMHLEMQWAVFVPLTLWAMHRAVERQSARYGLIAGLFIWLQVLACIYYGVFLAMWLAFFSPALLVLGERHGLGRKIAVIAIAAAVAVVLIVPFALPYIAASRDIGVRPDFEIARYSAVPINYLASPTENRLWGWTSNRWGSTELRLFPGSIAAILACASVLARPIRLVVLYALMAVIAIGFSLGTNNPAYAWLIDHVTVLQGFRSMARFGVLAGCAIAVLAGFGFRALVDRVTSRQRRIAWTAAAVALIAVEATNHPLPLQNGSPRDVPDVYRVLRSAPPGAVLEMPVPPLSALPGHDPAYQTWALWHWKPLVNGYSGYYPRDYITTIIRMEVFPEDASINRLRAHGVRYVVVHRQLYEPARLENLMMRIASRPELKPWGEYKDPLGMADLFELTDGS